jgi:choice-of-anchor B domain-containing protein
MKLKQLILFLLLGTSSLIYAQKSISLVGKLQITGLPIHDVWGYTDSLTGNRYGLLCASTSGLRVIDLSNLANPTIVGSISGAGIRAIDVKTWKNYAYIVGESLSITGKIIDLTDPTNPTQVGAFPAGHNITISESGYLYLSVPGIRIFDLNTDPINPVQKYSDNSCIGHDISIVGNRLYDFSDNCGTRIFDISQPDTLVSLGTVPASGMFHHSGWPSKDENYLFICDELASPSENDITVWDISNLSNPILVDSFADPGAYIHNLYVIKTFAYVSYYRAGFRLFDISDPLNIVLEAEYDTDSTLSGPGYGGNFGLFTLWGTNTILASDEENGLYIFDVSGSISGLNDEANPAGNNLSIFPNPVSGNTTLHYSIEKNEQVEILLYTSQGKLLKSFDEGMKRKGDYTLILSTKEFSKGIYMVKLTTEGETKTKRLIISN